MSGIAVFVYGTLKNMSRGKFLGKAVTRDKYVMFDGGFPLVTNIDDPHLKLIPNGVNPGFVKGQAYLVNDEELQHLDNYEGADELNTEEGFYFRRQIPITVLDSVDHELPSDLRAWMYFGGTARFGIPSRSVMEPDVDGNLNWVY